MKKELEDDESTNQAARHLTDKMKVTDRSIKLPHCVLTNHNPVRNKKSDKLKSDMSALMLVQNGIWEAHVFFLTRAPCAEPNGSVY